MELPQYTLHLTIKRMLFPRILLLVVLAPIFYFGIWLNSRLLGIEIPGFIAVFLILFLIILVIAQAILHYIAFQKFQYSFYTNRIEFEGKKPRTFLFSDFEQATLKQNILDKIFNTGSIQLSKTFSIGPISNLTQVKTYVEQLVRYYRYQQQRMQMRAAQQQAFGETGTIQARTTPTQMEQSPGTGQQLREQENTQSSYR